MSILSHSRRRSAAHPPWCDTARCLAGVNRLGEHRSAPMKVGPVVLTLALMEGAAQPALETRVRTRLFSSGDDAGQRHAAALTVAILKAVKETRVDHSGHNGTFPSTPGEV